MTTQDPTINRILAIMERSALLQTESMAKSDASLQAAEQAGQIADVVGLNWEIDVEPLLDERHTAGVPTDGSTIEPTTKCIGHSPLTIDYATPYDTSVRSAVPEQRSPGEHDLGRAASMQLRTSTALQGCVQHLLPCSSKGAAAPEQTRGSLGMSTVLVEFSTLDQWGEAAEYLDCAIFDIDDPSPERYATEVVRRSSQLGLELPCQADIVALPPGTVVPNEFKNRLLLDQATQLRFGSVGRVRIVAPTVARECFGVAIPNHNSVSSATSHQGPTPVVYRNRGNVKEVVKDVDIRSPYGCELWMRLIEEVDRRLDEGATDAMVRVGGHAIREQFEGEFGAEATDEALACGALLSYLNRNEPGFSAREHANTWRLCKKDNMLN